MSAKSNKQQPNVFCRPGCLDGQSTSALCIRVAVKPGGGSIMATCVMERRNPEFFVGSGVGQRLLLIEAINEEVSDEALAFLVYLVKRSSGKQL